MELQNVYSLEDLQCLIEKQDVVTVNRTPRLYRETSCGRVSFTRRVEALGAIEIIRIETKNLKFQEGRIESGIFFPDYYYDDLHPKDFARESTFLRTVGL